LFFVKNGKTENFDSSCPFFLSKSKFFLFFFFQDDANFWQAGASRGAGNPSFSPLFKGGNAREFLETTPFWAWLDNIIEESPPHARPWRAASQWN